MQVRLETRRECSRNLALLQMHLPGLPSQILYSRRMLREYAGAMTVSDRREYNELMF